jgi:hypothetical protein
MAAFGDRDALSFSTVDEKSKAAGSRAAAVEGKEQAKVQKEFENTKSTTGKTLLSQKKTIEKLATRANEITDPTKRKAFIASSKAALGDVKLGLELQAIIDKADEASNIAKDPKNLMGSDSILKATGKTGVSNTGKYYVKGVEVSPQEYANVVGGDDTGTGVGRGGGAGGTGTDGADVATGSLTAAQANLAQEARKSAYDLLYEQFNQYGLGSLVEGIKGLVQENVSPSEFAIRLRQTDSYKKRFAANAQRIAKGLTAIDEATYIGLEDKYQEIMRQYGLPETYYTRGEMGRQEGFEKFIGNDISAVELEDRIQTAQNRVLNANPEVARALKEFYPDITNGDILAYTLDPQNAIKNIQRKVTAAEIGGAAMAQGLQTGLARAEELAAAGVDKAAAQQGFETVAQVAPRGGQLAEFYKESPYTQATAEQEVFNLAGSAAAAQKRKKLTALETAAFSGQAGLGALARDRAGAL